MFVLKDYQLPQVAGGDHWGYEDSSGSAEENSSAANSYQNSSGTWGSPGLAVSTMQTVSLALARSGETASGCIEIQVGPATEQTCWGTDGSKSVQTCIGVGATASIGGFGGGVKGLICTTKAY